MTRLNRLSAVPVLLLLLTAFSVFAQEQPEGRAFTVKGIVGDVMVRRSPSADRVRRERAADVVAQARDVRGTQWTLARLNMTIREKDQLMTGAQSEVLIEADDGTVVKLGENTTIEVSVMKYGAENSRTPSASELREGVTATKIRVNMGSIVANIKKMMSGKSSFKFETPTATAAIRGTTVEFEVRKSAGGGAETHSIIRVFDGAAMVTPAGSRQGVELTHNKMVEVAPGQKALVVKDVPPDYKRMTTALSTDAKPDAKSDAKPAEAQDAKAAKDAGAQIAAPAGKADAGGKAQPAAAADTIKYHVRVLSPRDGHVTDKPVVAVSGTAAPGSKVSVKGVTLPVKDDGTFAGEVALPDKEGEHTIQIEIVDKLNNAVWIERNITYKKKK